LLFGGLRGLAELVQGLAGSFKALSSHLLEIRFFHIQQYSRLKIARNPLKI